MSAALRWLIVVLALGGTWTVTRRLFAATMRAADPARRALGRGVVYDPFLARHGGWLAVACATVSVADGAAAGGARFTPFARDAAAVACVGWCVLLVWADAVLARFFAQPGDPGAAPLLDCGPYAVVRHPRYLAWVGMLTSVAVVADAPAGLGAAFLFLVLVLRRIAREEHFLRRTRGAAYLRYAATTNRLLPWVY